MLGESPLGKSFDYSFSNSEKHTKTWGRLNLTYICEDLFIPKLLFEAWDMTAKRMLSSLQNLQGLHHQEYLSD